MTPYAPFMRIETSLGALFAALSVACATTPAPPVVRNVPQYDAATFFETTSIFGGSFSHDGQRLLVSSDESGVFNAYAVDLDSGLREQLTFSETDATYAAAWFPGDDRFLVTADSGGNELSHVYVVGPDGAQTDLTPGDKVKASFAGWRSDDAAFFITSNARDERYFDLYWVPISALPASGQASYTPELVYQNEGFDVSAISRDGRWVALTKMRNNADSNVYLVDTHGDATPVLLTQHEGNIAYGVETFTPDGKQLLLSTDEHGEWKGVFAYDLQTGKRKIVLDADWDVSFVRYSRNGRYRIHGVNADARTLVEIVDMQNKRRLELPEFPNGDIEQVRISDDGSLVAFYVNGDTSPSNLWVHHVADNRTVKLTHSLSPRMAESDLVPSVSVRYRSFDELEIPALLYRPHAASPDNPVPAIVLVHGGPGGQSRTGYNPVIQHLVNHGYGVLAVNNRGSSGYGKTFFHLDDRKHGEDDLDDCVWARRHLASLPWVDGQQIAIMGGSYGGYMVAAALAFRPTVFEAGIDIFGVTNFLRTLEEIPPWWEDFKEALYAEMGDPALEGERIAAMSPLFHADNIVRPLLVVQGANDPRVKQVESDELVAAVRANGVPVEYVLFEDEGHGFRNKQNRIAAQEAYLGFLDRYLSDTPRP